MGRLLNSKALVLTLFLAFGLYADFNSASPYIIAVPASARQLNTALARSQRGDTLLLESGKYRGNFRIPPGVTLRARENGKAHITGNGRGNAITMSNGSSAIGLSVSGGRIGIFSDGIDNAIIANRIHNNSTGIMAVAHFVKIEDNLIFRNAFSGIQLWNVDTDEEILNNTIVFNENHGLALGGACRVGFVNNIVAFNGRLTVQSNAESKVFQAFNVFLSYIQVNMVLPENNYSFDPEFVNSDTNDFRARRTSRIFNNGRNGVSIGSRVYTAL